MALAKDKVTSISLRKAIGELGVATITALRSNENGYKYITLITRKSESNNVYFGKNSSELLPSEGSDVLHLLKDATIVQTTNAEGEIRYKLSIAKNGVAATGYASASEMAALFGVVEESEFDMSAFKSEFQTKAVAAPAVKAGKLVKDNPKASR